MLPNFLCIGGQKCGTTSIWRMLDAHPQIFMAQPRETRFFFDDFQYCEGLQKYEINYFRNWNGEKAVGEKCPEYLYSPAVPQRLYDSLGADLRLIVSLRSPAQRAYSHWRHNLNMLRESRSFEVALSEESQAISCGRSVSAHFAYLGRGFYATQLKRYLHRFRESRFLFVDFHAEIAGDQCALTQRLATFLDVNRWPATASPYTDGRPFPELCSMRKANDESLQILRKSDTGSTVQEWIIRKPSPFLLEFSEQFAEHRNAAPALPRTIETELNDRYFRQEVRELESLIPFVTDGWMHE